MFCFVAMEALYLAAAALWFDVRPCRSLPAACAASTAEVLLLLLSRVYALYGVIRCLTWPNRAVKAHVLAAEVC